MDKHHQDFLSAISTLLVEGKIDPNTAGKLLNTAARYEERVTELEDQSPKH